MRRIDLPQLQISESQGVCWQPRDPGNDDSLSIDCRNRAARGELLLRELEIYVQVGLTRAEARDRHHRAGKAVRAR